MLSCLSWSMFTDFAFVLLVPFHVDMSYSGEVSTGGVGRRVHLVGRGEEVANERLKRCTKCLLVICIELLDDECYVRIERTLPTQHCQRHLISMTFDHVTAQAMSKKRSICEGQTLCLSIPSHESVFDASDRTSGFPRNPLPKSS